MYIYQKHKKNKGESVTGICSRDIISSFMFKILILIDKRGYLYLKERRVEKKANKEAFSAEKVRQTKEQLNLQTNLQGLKLS